MQEVHAERETMRRLPALLTELLGIEPAVAVVSSHRRDAGVDLTVDDHRGRSWIVQVKSTSRPGTVAEAARRLHAAAATAPSRRRQIPMLVVPYMTPAGARVAQAAGLSWLDLSGNASISAEGLRVYVRGRKNAFPTPGRPSSAFAPRSARVARTLMLDPSRWWRQKDLVAETALDDSQVSRVVRRLRDDHLLETKDAELRPASPGLLLEAWADDYRFDRHDVVLAHVTGTGMEVARRIADRLDTANVEHAFTGLPAAWAIDHFATFRLTTVYVAGDPRAVAELLGARSEERGANVQLVGPDDDGVFAGRSVHDGLVCASPAQVYLDLLHLPERARDAAEHLWREQAWSDDPV